jgi:hypothetical protein
MGASDPIRLWSVALGTALFGFSLAVAAVQAQPTRLMAAAKPQTTPAGKPLSDGERKTVEELQVEQKQLDARSARAMLATPDGRRRVPETIARQFGVPEKLVNDLRGRRMGYSEVTVALALSHQLMKRERALTQQQAVDRIVTLRKSGQDWGLVARDLSLRLADVVGEVKKADKQLARLDTARTARAARAEKPAR